MNQDRVIEIYLTALDLPPSERTAFLAQACGADADLRREVESLLAHAKTNDSFLATPAFRLAPSLTGQQIGHYRVERLLGAGGMGEVYLAHDAALQRPVAIKVLPVAFTRDQERVRRFKQEAQAASQLSHPNIITIHEIGAQSIQGETQHYIVTEYIAGQTLRERLKAAPLDVAQAIDVAIQMADALRVAHEAAIIHRDFKPENVMIRDDGGLVKVLDFGIAKLGVGDAATERRGEEEMAPSPVAPLLTSTGMIVGTASYMSPEQASGLPVDARTDVYAVGLVLYEMLTAQRVPRDEAGLPQLANALNGTPSDLAAIIRKALKPQREERYESAAALLADLRRVQERLRSGKLRRWLKASAMAVLSLLVIALSSIWLAQGEEWKEHIFQAGHTAGLRRAVFSPKGDLLVSVGEDNQVLVWDFARRELRQKLTDHQGFVVAVSFAPDGKHFATASWDQTVIVWDAASLTKTAVLHDHRAAVTGVAFSPDGKYLASASKGPDDHAVLWRTGSWEKVRDLPMWGGDWAPLYFAPNNPQLLFNSAQIYDVEAGRKVDGLLHPEGSGMGFSPDGAQLVIVDSFGTIHFVDTVKQRAIEKPQVHRDHGRAAAFSPDGKMAVTGSEDIILWNAVTQELILRWEHTSYVWSLAWSPDGRYVVSTHGDGSILLWDVVARERVANLSQHSHPVGAVAISPDGKRIASGSEDHSIILWDAITGRKEAVLLGLRTRIRGLAFSPNGEWLASSDQNGEIIRWNLATRQAQWAKQGDNLNVAISPDGRWVASSMSVLDSATGEPLVSFERKDTGFGGAASFSADGKRMATIGRGYVSVWETGSWRLLASHAVEEGGDAVSLAPDGQHLVIGYLSGKVELLQTEPLRPLGLLGRHQARVRQVAYSPDSLQIASISDDKTIKLWDVSWRRHLPGFLRHEAEVGTHTAPVLSLAFAPNGEQLVSGEHDKSVRLYTRRRTLFGWRRD